MLLFLTTSRLGVLCQDKYFIIIFKIVIKNWDPDHIQAYLYQSSFS